MKDLTVWSKDKKLGYYYLNHFVGIDSYMRPLTIHSYISMKSLIINIPIIESNYTSSQFDLRVN